MKQQLFSLTGGILDLNEHLNVNCLGQGYASHRRGHCFSGVRAPGPWLRLCAAYFSPGAGTAQSLTGIVTEAGSAARRCVCVWVCACAGCSPLVSAEEGSWTSEVSGICDRMGLHIHRSPRMVLEAPLLLSLRISGSFVLTGYLPIGIRKHLLEFIFKWFQLFKDPRDPKDL